MNQLRYFKLPFSRQYDERTALSSCKLFEFCGYFETKERVRAVRTRFEFAVKDLIFLAGSNHQSAGLAWLLTHFSCLHLQQLFHFLRIPTTTVVMIEFLSKINTFILRNFRSTKSKAIGRLNLAVQ